VAHPGIRSLYGRAGAGFPALALALLLRAGPAEASFIPGGFLRGDADLDGSVAITDAILVLNHLFLGGAAPACEDPADANDDGALDLSDPISMLEHLFLGAPGLPPPGPLTPGHDVTPDPYPCGDVPGEATLDADQVFESLTATDWVWTLEGFQNDEEEHLAFRKDGAFSRCGFSDAPRGSSSGFWSFEKTTAAGGTLVLSTGDFLRFYLREDGALVIVNRVFEPGPYVAMFSCEPPPPESCPACGRNDLNLVHPPALIAELSGRNWRKPNDLDLYNVPASIDFSDTGRYTASFRGGECSFGGFWSALGEGILADHDYDLILERPRPGCDFRDPAIAGSFFLGHVTEIRDGILRLDDEIYTESPDPLEGVFLRTGLNSILELEGRYTRPLRRAHNACRLEIRTPSDIPAGSIRVFRQALIRSDGRHVEAEDRVLLDELNLPPVPAGGTFGFEIDLDATGTRTPEVRFELEIKPRPIGRSSFIVSL
jgi:hypothetical protein